MVETIKKHDLEDHVKIIDAIYDKEKHPQAWGRVRGRNNVNNTVTWLCLDIDDTTVTDEEMHRILGNLNHHIARTSNKDNP